MCFFLSTNQLFIDSFCNSNTAQIGEPDSIYFVFATGNTYITEENVLFVNFTSDAAIETKGFQLSYKSGTTR